MANPNIFAIQDLRWNNAGTTYRGIWLDLQNGAGGSAIGAAASRSLRLSNNGLDFFYVDLIGTVRSGSGGGFIVTGNGQSISGNRAMILQDNGGGGNIGLTGAIQFSANGTDVGGSFDVVLTRDAANTLALRNGANSQQFSIYNTFTDTSNYERLEILYQGNIATVQTNQLGTGQARTIQIGTVGNNPIGFFTNNNNRWQIQAAGHFIALTDNSIDIGSVGANRPRNYFGAGYVLSRILTSTKTTNYTVVDADSGTYFDNSGAAGEVDFTLPTPTSPFGEIYTFYVRTAQTLKVIATNSATIRLAGSASAANGNITNATIGGSVTLYAVSATSWLATAINGTWVVT